MQPEKRLLTKREAMDYLALRSGTTFDRLAKRLGLPRVEMSKRTIRYRVADLDKFIREQLEH